MLFPVSCKNDIETINDNIKFSFNDEEWSKNHVIPGEIIKEINYIPLETHQECLLGEIKKVLTTDDLFYIQDRGINQKVFIFNKGGNYITSIGTYGKGPGELIDLTDFDLDPNNDRIFILDNHQNKVIICNQYTGQLIKEIKIDFHSKHIASINDNTIAFHSYYNNFNKQKKYSIAYMNIDNEKVNWHLPQDPYDTPLSYELTFFKSKSIFYTSYFKDIVYKLEENNVIPYIKLNFGINKIPSDKIINTRDKNRKIIELIKESDWSYGIKNVFETDKLLVFDFKFKQQNVQVYYSKESGNLFYGNKFENPIETSLTLKHYAVFDDKLITVIDPFLFESFEKNIPKNENQPFNKHYQEIKKYIDNQNHYPNPIIRIVKYDL